MASLLALAVSGSLHAQSPTPATQSDWGGAGLLQTPTARMADDGEFAFTASHTSPYSRYNFSLQPFPWFEGTFRYINVAGVRYGPQWFSGDQNYKDKSIDFKLRLWEESRWLPEVAFGVRDLGGTGLFSSEYGVASKRFGPVDASIGLATGYLGSNGDFENPLGWIDDRFNHRPDPTSAVVNAGKLGLRYMFRGPVGVFGGVAWQTPWEPLLVKVEYDGHDYEHEPRVGTLLHDSRFNFGLQYSASPGVKLSLGWQRGNELSAALTLRGNLASAERQMRWMDPPKVPLYEDNRSLNRKDAIAPTGEAADVESGVDHAAGPLAGVPPLRPERNWDEVARWLGVNAGIAVQDVSVSGRELIVRGSQRRYFYPAEALGRTARVLDNSVGPEIDWFTIEHTRHGLPLAQTSVSRQALADYVKRDIDLDTLARQVELNPPGSSREGNTVYKAPLRRGNWNVAPGFSQIIGGPDAFLLYQVSVNADAGWRFSPHTWLSGTVSANVLNNYDRFRYDAPSKLPRVRTDMRQYVTTSDITVPNLQLTTARALGRDLYGMAYAGMLESMFGGIGGEVLYRPFGERWALGVDANWVQQRDYNQHFGFRDYRVATGHATLYQSFGRQQRVVGSLAAGRYLAGDWGATLNVARAFPNGVTMGAWATKTNVSSADFGEGSFDKGIYLTLPMDFLLPRSTRGRASLVWNPLLRDGGAGLFRRYALYPLTSERDGDLLFDNLRYIDP
ncbi:YjbH domain-containing protein [Pseudoxanthomonas suwonensis]|nr:YjbH domain-containing protein [Pseudoxanthomonas suwonensis]